MQSDRQPTSHRSKNRRVRYDRMLAVLLILILLIVLLTKCCSSCSNRKKANSTVQTTTTTATNETTTEAAQQSYANTVYLSPSNQVDNAFSAGDTNEAAECRVIAEKTAAILQQSGLTVIVANEDDSLQTKTAVGDNGLAAYVAIHTNAGTGVGTDCYYNSNSEQSKALAQAVYQPVADLTPTADRGLLDGTQDTSDYLYEVANNQSPCCLVEVEFHDGPNVAQWILDNEDGIAAAIASGICSYLQVSSSGTAVTATTADSTADGSLSATGTAGTEANAIQDQLSSGT